MYRLWRKYGSEGKSYCTQGIHALNSDSKYECYIKLHWDYRYFITHFITPNFPVLSPYLITSIMVISKIKV